MATFYAIKKRSVIRSEHYSDVYKNITRDIFLCAKFNCLLEEKEIPLVKISLNIL